MTARSLASLGSMLVVLAASTDTQAADPDPWWGRDKALHFGASATIAAGGYTLGAAAFDARYQALLLGSALSLAAGTGKELADMAGYGNPSWRDFTWDVVGTVVGLGLAWGVDLAVRGTGKDHPALTPASRAEPLHGGFAISF